MYFLCVFLLCLASLGLFSQARECPKSLRKTLTLTSQIIDTDQYAFQRFGKHGQLPFKKVHIWSISKELAQYFGGPAGQINQGQKVNGVPSFAFQEDETSPSSTATPVSSTTTATPIFTPSTTEPVEDTNATTFLGVTEGTHTPSNDSEPIENILIWKLQLPRNAIHVSAAPIEKGVLLADGAYSFNLEELRTGNRSEDASETVYADVTEYDIIGGHWYLVCLNQSIIQGGTQGECQQCELVQADALFPPIELTLVESSVTIATAQIAYQVRDLPIPDGADVVTSALPVPDDSRCARIYERPHFISQDPIRPNTVTIVNVDNLAPDRKYRFSADVVFPVQNGHLLGISDSKIIMSEYITTAYADSLTQVCS